MPYITQEERESLDKRMERLTDVTLRPGHLAYVICKLTDRFVGRGNYSQRALAIGVLETAKLELVRRIVSSYEDEKIEENGDLAWLSSS